MTSSQLENSISVSANTQAILLLTAPLIAGHGESSQDFLTPAEYGKLARFLRETQRQPADLLASDPAELLVESGRVVNGDRLKRLLARGFLLGQAIDRWQTRAIWVVSRADEEYPARLKERLKDLAPPVLYGCGDASLLNTGGLAVVGSRHADDSVLEYTMSVGRLTAEAKRTLVSGSARGIDQAAMRGALMAGGKAVGVLADSLERAALNRDHRNLLMEGELVLISPYDPSAGFNVGRAMQRNKLIYALADAALVVNSDYGKGGTWAGAVEQLEKLHLVPVYVRTNGEVGTGLEALRRKGALPWPNPAAAETVVEALAVCVNRQSASSDTELFSLSGANENMSNQIHGEQQDSEASTSADTTITPPADVLFATVRSLLERLDTPKTDKEIASELKVSTSQVKEWLQRLVKDGVLEKLSRPTRYRSTNTSTRLF